MDLIKRKKELETKRKELESSLLEISKEKKAIENRLIEKRVSFSDDKWGWDANGSPIEKTEDKT